MGCAGSKQLRCSISPNDPRMDGEEPALVVNEMNCVLTITMPPLEEEGERRSSGSACSIFDEDGVVQKQPAKCAIACTDKKMLLDVSRMKNGKQLVQEYLNVAFNTALVNEAVLAFTNDDDGAHLIIELPNAHRFFAKEIKCPKGAAVKISMGTWKAPDICTHVQGQVLNGDNASVKKKRTTAFKSA
eukprot:NODE_14593_length_1098_cov_11.595263.p2 GENE.NODE_14593_length_1098_cov_11.595263~~NODE_14593_length_1098_cov_11.595263.p2  ORF type:complete len:187 (+),score=27.44 NODE_14593_length_1098_cov_11.595263:138-698(+)